MVRLVVDNMHQKDMCNDEIRLGMCSKYSGHHIVNLIIGRTIVIV